MSEYEKAVANFMAKQSPQVIPPTTNKAEHQAVRREAYKARKERARQVVFNNTLGIPDYE